jgi:3-oxoacyl-[acyl-carrier protein] reductase
MDLGIEGRVALVSGASKGIGRAIAAELVREGAKVAVASRSQERIEEAARAVGATPFVHDTAELDRAPGLVAEVGEALGGPVEILVTNTGGPPPGPALSFSREEWEAAYRTLVLAPLALIEAALPGMRERGWGRIVNVGSTTNLEPIDGLMLSNVHRTGTLSMFKTIAREVARDGVTLNHVLPGRIATDRLIELAGGSREVVEENAQRDVPAGRLGEPADMAAAAAFLCSDRAGYITGSWIAVDGGLLKSL